MPGLSDFREEGTFMKDNIDDQIRAAEQKRLEPPEDKYLICKCGHSEEDHQGDLLNTQCLHTIPYFIEVPNHPPRTSSKYDCECEEFRTIE